MLLTSSCVVADPPEYRDPVQSRPVLDVYHADPPALQLIVAEKNSPSPIKISVPVRSEDAGEDLQANTYLDFNLPSQQVLNLQTIPASTYDNEGRTVNVDFSVTGATEKGCHLLSIVVAHRDTFQLLQIDRLDPKKADTDAAIINWWVNVDPDPGQERSLINCPSTDVPKP